MASHAFDVSPQQEYSHFRMSEITKHDVSVCSVKAKEDVQVLLGLQTRSKRSNSQTKHKCRNVFTVSLPFLDTQEFEKL